jgi:hypothetical protein
MNRILSIIALTLVAASWSPDVHAQWQWRDKSGQTHVSDLPPPRDIPDKDVLQRPAPPAAPAAPPAPSTPGMPAAPGTATPATGTGGAATGGDAAPAANQPRVDPELEARRKQAEQEQQAKAREAETRLAAQRAENCTRARASLRSLEGGMRLARVNEKGEREILDDKARANEMQQARRAIGSDCR